MLISFEFTSLFIGPEHEQIHGSDLGDLFLLPEQPEHLLTALGRCFLLDKHGGGIITERNGSNVSLNLYGIYIYIYRTKSQSIWLGN